MKKLFMMLLTLFLLYLGLQFVFNIFSKGSDKNYIIEDGKMKFEVQEKSYFSNNSNNYSYSIKAEKTTFNFQIDKNFNKSNQVLTKIKYYKDNEYECILPIFKNDTIIIDMMCYDSIKMTYYYNLKDNKSLNTFISGIEEYNEYQFADNAKTEKIESLGIYTDNLIDNHYLAITNYKGVFDISKKFNSIAYNISLFREDEYNPKLAMFIDNYYITADYNQQYEFRDFNIVDLVKLNKDSIRSESLISLDSYIQGVVDNVLYIYDKDNKIQYEINVEKQTIVPYSGNNLKYYDNGTWTTMTLVQANDGLKFNYGEVDYKDAKYARIDKVGEEVGYYYLYKKNGNNYDVYSMDIQNKDSLKYIFSTKTIDNIYYIDNYVYFVNNNKVQVFNHNFGIKNIVQYNELQFNKNLSLYVYSK